jgi:hypothetical protein
MLSFNKKSIATLDQGSVTTYNFIINLTLIVY